MFIYLEIDHGWEEGQGERERDSSSRLHAEQGTLLRVQSHDPERMTSAKIKSPRLNLLSHLGTPSLFNFLRNFQTTFHSVCTSLHLHQLLSLFWYLTLDGEGIIIFAVHKNYRLHIDRQPFSFIIIKTKHNSLECSFKEK